MYSITISSIKISLVLVLLCYLLTVDLLSFVTSIRNKVRSLLALYCALLLT